MIQEFFLFYGLISSHRRVQNIFFLLLFDQQLSKNVGKNFFLEKNMKHLFFEFEFPPKI